MKRLKRDPVKFDIFAAFGHFAAQHGISIRADDAVIRFGDAVRAATESSLDNDIMVFGTRVQAMFETVVAALGKVKAIKQEDVGEGYFDENVIVPDYRIVLDDQSQILVEVKNFNQKHGLERFELKLEYLQRIQAYAKLMSIKLLFAVYWYGWNFWTLVPAEEFVVDGDKAMLEMGDALRASQMIRLGDLLIGTRWPLRFRVEVRQLGQEGTRRTAAIREIQLFSEDRVISDPVERRIAMMLMLYGDWIEEEIVEDHDGVLAAVEYRFAPREGARKQDEQGFDTNAWISSLISRFFRRATITDGEVSAFRVDFDPGEFGRLIPDDYDATRAALPLWRFRVRPL